MRAEDENKETALMAWIKKEKKKMKVIGRLKNMNIDEFVGVVKLVLYDECFDPVLAACQCCKIRDICKSYDDASTLIGWLRTELE